MTRQQDGQTRQPIELMLQALNRHLDRLRTQFNLYFAGELRVPPESDRENLERQIRQLQNSSQRSARLSLLQENLVSQFALYNNMWQKKMADREQGVNRQEKTPAKPATADRSASTAQLKDIAVDLNQPNSFAPLGRACRDLLGTGSATQHEKMIQLLQQKLAKAGIPQARIMVRMEEGKLRFKVKPVTTKS